MTTIDILNELNSLASPEHLAKLKHFGIEDIRAIGVRVPLIRKLAKQIGVNQQLAQELWLTAVHEARILATMIADPKVIAENQVDGWVSDFDSWDLCDVACDMIAETPYVLAKIEEYSVSNEEFVKRTAFTLMCKLAFRNSGSENAMFERFFEIIEREAWDERNFVRKAVNWALRQIGKRNEVLRVRAVEVGERILLQDTKAARWIANDALRELNSEVIVRRVQAKAAR